MIKERPDSPEEKEKCFEFKAKTYTTIVGTVWARTREEALEFIELNLYDVDYYDVEQIADVDIKEE